MGQVVDYSFQKPAAAAIRSAGYLGAVRYLSPPPNEKNLSVDERDALHAEGLSIGLVWETTTSRAAAGRTAGGDDGRRANALADELGAPPTAAIYYAVDSNAYGPPDVAPYFEGVLAAGGRPAGVYGSEAVCEAMLDLGCRYAWQVETWGNGVSPRAALVQLPNVRAPIPGTDVNDVRNADWGQWAPGGTGWGEIDRYLHQEDVALNDPAEDWQTTGGVHVPTSWHYRGMARDASTGTLCDEAGIVAALLPFAVPGGPVIELFHAATNTWLNDGVYTNVGGHTDHVHVAIRPGASLPVTFIPIDPPEDDMRLIGVTNNRGIFLISGSLQASGKAKGKALARYIETTEDVTALVESHVVPEYNQKPDLPEALFNRLFSVVP